MHAHEYIRTAREVRPARRRGWSAVVLLAVAAVITACSEAAPSDPTDWSTQADEMSPILIEALTPDPIPVRGSDERFHAAYELTVLNFAPRPATITEVQILAPDGTVLSTLSQQEVAERTMVVADYAPPADGGISIPSGKTALLVLEVTADDRASLPASVSHQISASYGAAETGGGKIAELWPDTASQRGGEVTISTDEPVVIGSPLSGSGWLVSAACCTLNVHRNVLLPVGGRINGGERYALDLSQVDVEGIRENGFTQESVVHGDPAVNEDYRAYGASVLAVADATVVFVEKEVPDTVAGTLPIGPGFTLGNLGGNVVVLELAPDLFAVYYHLAPGSPSVKVGDRVSKGQEIALLGNSGNTSAAHLHFQVSRTPLIFSSDSVPYEIEEFTLVGGISDETGELIEAPGSGARKNALPLALDVIDFP